MTTRRTLPTPQSRALDARQVKNTAGGYTYALDKWARLDRFLILGSDGGTFHVGERKLTRDNAKVVEECAKENSILVCDRIMAISKSGRAPKNDAAVFALAIVASMDNKAARQAALAALPIVCRIPTHLFQFVAARDQMRGWSRSLRTAVGSWYNSRPIEQLAYQVVKYQQREGWSNRDLLRLSHAKPKLGRGGIFRWIVKGSAGRLNVPDVIEAFDDLKGDGEDTRRVVRYIKAHGLTREMVPTEALQSAAVWDALLDKMPLHATVRNLGKMTSIGLLEGNGDAVKQVVTRLTDADYIRKSRLHPLAILVALKTYAGGHGIKGNLRWTPNKKIEDALDNAFYLAFDNVKPTGKRLCLAIDMSGSMTWESSQIAGTPLVARDAAAALAMVALRIEKNATVLGFTAGMWNSRRTSGVSRLDIKPTWRLDKVVEYMDKQTAGGTDCAMPILFAQQTATPFDAFITLTDNETWAGPVHVKDALRNYRDSWGPAKLVAVGMTATEYTVNDPTDPLGLDVVGFDTATPAVINGFIDDFDYPVEDQEFDTE